MSGALLLVIPTVIEVRDGDIYFDRDFANNLEAYLRNFDTVTVACPATRGGFPGTRLIHDIPDHKRVSVVVLPEPYREDRFLRKKSAVARLLGDEIDAARFILVSPHAPFDWSTLAAEICIAKGRKYNMEADWNLPYTAHYIWSQMPFGLNKLRKRLWLAHHTPKYWRCLRHSALSLVQGEDVFNDYRSIAPNAHSVLNVQITDEQRIDQSALAAKLARASKGGPLRIVYAGRAIEMKGPLYWLAALQKLTERGVNFKATWFGDGDMVPAMDEYIRAHQLNCNLQGSVARDQVLEAMREADIFMFCHMTKESPRCLVEALASAAPIVGFGTDYSRSLVRERGGGSFVKMGDTADLASLITRYSNSPDELAALIKGAFESSLLLDRERAIQQRIDLMKDYL